MKVRVKLRLVILAAAMVACSILAGGCGSEFAGGTAAGAAASGALQGIMQAYQVQMQETVAQLTAAQQRLEQASSEADRLAAEAQVQALKDQIEKQAGVQAAGQLGIQAEKTNWSDPQSVSGFTNAAAILIAGWMIKKYGAQSQTG